ncbi:uncharacterized protein EKO05_0011086 [Ascochyta rabiei]|uniref:uncharacterized protein n=1 Tax=Didymella rabiei TaxID=5454 RepID=UPI00220F45E8|nr:uncharacterized protein EKO05_0011086 [Ascochyta rabiei]UPX20872.1 hypothetical protein EKO05_0011086 [Ascochyta rabiei]
MHTALEKPLNQSKHCFPLGQMWNHYAFHASSRSTCEHQLQEPRAKPHIHPHPHPQGPYSSAGAWRTLTALMSRC